MQFKKMVLLFLSLFLFLACSLLKSPEERQMERDQRALAQAKIAKENMFHGTLIEIQCRLGSGEMMTKSGTADVLTGAAAGWLIMGKTGAIVGAVAGAEQNRELTQISGEIESLIFKVLGNDGLEYTFEILEKDVYLNPPPYCREDDVSKDMLANMQIGSTIKIPVLIKLSRLATVNSRLVYYESENIPGL